MPPETLDSLDKDSLKPLVLQLLAQNKSLLERIDTLLARIAELEGRAGKPPKTPTNSSLPPSTGQKANVSEAPRKRKGRRGRPGVTRALAEKPDATRDVYADKCACGTALSATDQPDVFAYDHIELPPIKPVTTRIHLHKGHCPCCKRRFAASPPADMAPGSPFGPGIVALVTYLHACQMVSYSRMTEVLDGLFGLKLSEGAIANMLARAEKPFAARADEIAETVRTSPVIASDETSARVCGKTHWQWTFVASSAVYHTMAPTRGKVVPVDFLGDAKPKVWLGRVTGRATAAIIDVALTQVVDGDVVKLFSWYDNEWSYAAQLVRKTRAIARSMGDRPDGGAVPADCGERKRIGSHGRRLRGRIGLERHCRRLTRTRGSGRWPPLPGRYR